MSHFRDGQRKAPKPVVEHLWHLTELVTRNFGLSHRPIVRKCLGQALFDLANPHIVCRMRGQQFRWFLLIHCSHAPPEIQGSMGSIARLGHVDKVQVIRLQLMQPGIGQDDPQRSTSPYQPAVEVGLVFIVGRENSCNCHSFEHELLTDALCAMARNGMRNLSFCKTS